MENKQQPVVNICGSCILRDAFYYQGVYGKEKDGGYRSICELLLSAGVGTAAHSDL